MWIKVGKFLIPLCSSGVKFIEMKEDEIVFVMHHERSVTNDLSTKVPVAIAETGSNCILIADKKTIGEKEFCRLTDDLNVLAGKNVYRSGLDIA